KIESLASDEQLETVHGWLGDLELIANEPVNPSLENDAESAHATKDLVKSRYDSVTKVSRATERRTENLRKELGPGTARRPTAATMRSMVSVREGAHEAPPATLTTLEALSKPDAPNDGFGNVERGSISIQPTSYAFISSVKYFIENGNPVVRQNYEQGLIQVKINLTRKFAYGGKQNVEITEQTIPKQVHEFVDSIPMPSTPQQKALAGCFLTMNDIELEKVLGEGGEGLVMLGIVRGHPQLAFAAKFQVLNAKSLARLQDPLVDGCSVKHPAIAEVLAYFPVEEFSKENELMVAILSELGDHMLADDVEKVHHERATAQEKNDTRKLNALLKFVLKAFQHIFSGVAALNENNIIHRDIKLSNIISCDGSKLNSIVELNVLSIKIIDLGMSKFVPEEASDLSKRCGTVDFMPPTPGNRCFNHDVWSLMMTLYHALMGGWLAAKDQEAGLKKELVLTALTKTWTGASEEILDGFANLISKMAVVKDNAVEMDAQTAFNEIKAMDGLPSFS
ncbi:MAG: hypothetical protein SGILL_003068, partial [Bacillariaceae sp.]